MLSQLLSCHPEKRVSSLGSTLNSWIEGASSMKLSHSKLAFAIVWFATCSSDVLLAQVAERPSKETIVDALRPRKLRGMRGVNVEPGQAVQTPPSINLKVNFAYKSAELTTDARLVLQNLGKALNDPTLKDYRFRVGGHTDAVGGDEYNQALSEARAKAVVDHLIASFGIAPSRLEARGFGKTQLTDPANPTADINRRVEIVNIGQ